MMKTFFIPIGIGIGISLWIWLGFFLSGREISILRSVSYGVVAFIAIHVKRILFEE